MRKITLKLIAPLILAALMLTLSTGCGSLRVIREDSVREDYEEIDPEAGASGEIDVSLYYRLAYEEYLVEIPYTMETVSSRRAEKGIVEALLVGAALGSAAEDGAAEDGAVLTGAVQTGAVQAGAVQTVIPEGTELADISLDGSILYVTLSKEFVSTDIVDAAAAVLGPKLNAGAITQDDYYVGIMEATSEMYTRRRLGAISIINAVTRYNESVEVQLLIDSDGNGVGERMRRTEFGFAKLSSADTELIEPMRYSETTVATPKTVLHCALERLTKADHGRAYPLFDVSVLGEAVDAAAFEEAMTSRGAIISYELKEAEEDGEGGYTIEADIEAEDAKGAAIERKGVSIGLVERDGIYQADLASLMEAVWGE